MTKLNLTAMSTEEIILKDYLENNASETLAEKINNGVRIEKDGKTLINKKTLEHFMNDYAHKEAQKQTKQGARCAIVYKDAIFNWLIHYFEEDSIHGMLYNEDGTEYKPPAPVKKSTTPSKQATTTSTLPPIKKMSLFDLMDEKKLEDFKLDGEPEVAEIDECTQESDEAESTDKEPQEVASEPAPEAIGQPVGEEKQYTEPKSELMQVSKKHYADTSNGIVYEVPSFITTLFGDALKVEVV